MSRVWDWIHSLLSSPVRVAEDVLRIVRQAVSELWHTLTDCFYAVRKAWALMVTGAKVVAGLLEDTASALYKAFRYLYRTYLPKLTKTVWGWVQTARALTQTLVTDLYHWVAGKLADLWDYAKGIITWALAHIYNPLHDALTQAWQWITDRGSVLWHYVQHPETLAALLLAPLLSVALRWVRGHTDVIARWLMASLLGALLEAADIIEEIFADLV
jgi:hypothetical protein